MSRLVAAALRGPALVALLAGCASPVAPTPPPAGGATALFDAAVLHEVEVVLDPLDWRTLRENFESNQYYVADIRIDGELVAQAGVRSRGGGTRSGTKPSLQVKFDEYVKTQRFQGLERVAIKNLLDDASFLREYLSMAVYRAMGVAAPEVSFARLTVNGEYFGLYNLIENVDESFLEKRFSESTGQLYDYEYAGPWDFSFRGEEATSYVPRPFQPETREDDPDVGALIDFIRAVNSGPDQTWAADMAAFLDPAEFLTFLAVENALTAGDGLVGVFGVNNFFLYQQASSRRFVFVAWDRGATFQASQWPIFHRTDQTVLTRRFLADPAMAGLYAGTLRRTVTECLNESVLGQQLEAAYVLVREAALTDPKKPYSNEEFEMAVSHVRDVVAGRRADVLAQIGALEASAGRSGR